MRLVELLNDRSVSPEAIAEFVRMERHVTDAEKNFEQQRSEYFIASEQRDLYARRAQIAFAILRDDEHGLGSEQLELIARQLWPPVKNYAPDPTQIPTDEGSWGARRSHMDLELTADGPTATEAELFRLLHVADGLFAAILMAAPEGFQWGHASEQLTDWRADKTSIHQKVYGA